jgi:hypothetical protein
LSVFRTQPVLLGKFVRRIPPANFEMKRLPRGTAVSAVANR